MVRPPELWDSHQSPRRQKKVAAPALPFMKYP